MGRGDVWKIGGKVFAIGGWQDEGEALFVTFKCSDMSYELLKDTAGCRPAPYLAARGMKWIQRTSDEGLDDAGLKDYIAASYRLVASGLDEEDAAGARLSGRVMDATWDDGAFFPWCHPGQAQRDPGPRARNAGVQPGCPGSRLSRWSAEMTRHWKLIAQRMGCARNKNFRENTHE